MYLRLLPLALIMLIPSSVLAQTPTLKILFLGDNAGHRPELRFRILQPVLEKRGIELTYTDTAAALRGMWRAWCDRSVLPVTEKS